MRQSSSPPMKALSIFSKHIAFTLSTNKRSQVVSSLWPTRTELILTRSYVVLSWWEEFAMIEHVNFSILDRSGSRVRGLFAANILSSFLFTPSCPLGWLFSFRWRSAYCTRIPRWISWWTEGEIYRWLERSPFRHANKKGQWFWCYRRGNCCSSLQILRW